MLYSINKLNKDFRLRVHKCIAFKVLALGFVTMFAGVKTFLSKAAPQSSMFNSNNYTKLSSECFCNHNNKETTKSKQLRGNKSETN